MKKRKKGSTEKNNVHDVLADMVPPPSSEDNWFVCMNLETSISAETKEEDKKKTSRQSNDKRTRIYVSHAPLSLTKAMNHFGTFKPISFTQQNSEHNELKNRNTTKVDGVKRRSVSRSSKHTATEKRYDIACIVGPIKDEKKATRFKNMWSASRGLQPRAAFASLLTEELDMPIIMNVDVVFDAEKKGLTIIHEKDVDEQEIKNNRKKSSKSGMVLQFVLNEQEQNKTTLKKRKRNHSESNGMVSNKKIK